VFTIKLFLGELIIKKIFIICILIINLNANDTNETKSSLELFLLKIGISGIVSDLENKEIKINKNNEKIESINSDVKYLLQQNIKNKLLVKDDSSSLLQKNQDEELALLKAENARLKIYLQTLENEKAKRIENTKRIKALENKIKAKKVNVVSKIQKSTKSKKTEKKKKKKKKTKYKVVFTKKAAIHVKPDGRSKISRYVKYGDILEIQKCTYYDWCRIQGKREYIAKYKIKKIN